jgi:hypothetical protein
VAVFAIFALLHLHALRRREMLELDELEVHDTRDNIRECVLNAAVCIASIAVAANGVIARRRRMSIMARVSEPLSS